MSNIEKAREAFEAARSMQQTCLARLAVAVPKLGSDEREVVAEATLEIRNLVTTYGEAHKIIPVMRMAVIIDTMMDPEHEAEWNRLGQGMELLNSTWDEALGLVRTALEETLDRFEVPR